MSRFIRGCAAFLTLCVVLFGIPIALLVVGGRPWQLHRAAANGGLNGLPNGVFSESVIIALLALVIWIAWLRLAVAVVIELVALMGGRSIRRTRILGSAQGWAAALVSMMTLLVGLVPRGTLAISAPAVRPIPVALLQHVEGNVVDFVTESNPTATADAPMPSQAPTTATHTVERNDSFWSIAQSTLGDGARWREIVSLNTGRVVAPGVVFDGTSRRLLPGWVLLLPSPDSASTVTPPGSIAPEVPASTPAQTVRVGPGDTLSSIAARELGDSRAWTSLWEANRGRRFGDRTFSDPNLIVTGWDLVVPSLSPQLPPPQLPQPEPQLSEAPPAVVADDVPLVTTNESPAPTSTPAPVTPVPVTPAPVFDQQPERRHDDDLQAPVDADDSHAFEAALAGAVLLAGGVVGSIATRRRRHLRASTVNSRIVEPPSLVARTQHLLRRLEAGERVARLDIALRAAAAELVAAAPGVLIVGALMAADGRIDLILTAPDVLPPHPWTDFDDGWRLEADVELMAVAEAARRCNQPCPALAHLGTTIDGGTGENADLFIDLEAIGLLTIDAQQPHTDDLLRAIGAGLALSPLAETAHFVTVGLDGWQLDHRSSHHADSMDIALDIAAGLIGSTATATSASVSTFTLRARRAQGEAWEPAVVIASDFEHARLVDSDLVDISASGGRGLAVVLGRPLPGAHWRIEYEVDRWMLEPLHIEFRPLGLSGADVARVQDILDEADRPLIVLSDPEPATEFTFGDERPWIEPEWQLMVRVLGSVEVVDREASALVEFERSKALELVAWLSQHRDRSTRSGARTALWESDVRDATFANVVSDARRALARRVPPPDGEEWIGRTLTEQLPLHSSVTTDADQLTARLAAARQLDPVAAIEVLRPGLELIRDLPFAGTAYLWPDTEGITSNLTLLVTSAATLLASQYLACDDIDGVFWATGQGLKVLAGHEELIALRMRAHVWRGDLAGVRDVWSEYERAINSDVWSDGEFAPKLVDLRRQLLKPTLVEA